MIISHILRKNFSSPSGLCSKLLNNVALNYSPRIESAFRFNSSINSEILSSLSLNQKTISDENELIFKRREIYRLTLTSCEVLEKPFEKIIQKIFQNSIREVVLVRTKIPEEKIPLLLESACLSNVSILNLTGLELSQKNNQLLKDLLPQSQIQELTISCHDEEKKLIGELCTSLSIQFSGMEIQKRCTQIERPFKANKPFVYFSTSLQDSVQGGFGSYQLIENESDFQKMTEFLKEGFLVTNILSRNGKESSLSGFIFTIAPGRGFICPLNTPFKDNPKNSTFPELKKVFENPLSPKIFFFYRYDFLLLNNHGITTRGLLFDLHFAKRYLNFKKISYILKNAKKIHAPKELEIENSCDFISDKLLSRHTERGDVFFKIYLKIVSLLQKKGIYAMISKILLPLEENLMISRAKGIRINPIFLEQYKGDIHSRRSQAKLNYENYVKLNQQNLSPFLGMVQKAKIAIKKVWSGDISKEFDSLSMDRLIAAQVKTPDESLLLANYLRHFIQEEKTQYLINHSNGEILKSIYRTPDIFRGIRLLPDPTIFQQNIYPKFFQANKNEELILAEVRDLSLRALAHLSGDSNLKKFCNQKNKIDLENRISKSLFGSVGEFLEKTHYLNLFACGKINKDAFSKIFSDHEALILKYYSVFPKVELFHGEMDQDSYKVYKKIRMQENTLFSMKYIYLSKKILDERVKASIIFASGHQILFSVEEREKGQFNKILSEVNQELSLWSVSTPLEVTPLSEEQNKDPEMNFLNHPTQGVIEDICELPNHPIQIGGSFFSRVSSEFNAQVEQTLKIHFNSMKLKPLQQEVIHFVLEKKSTIALLPTGYGKSACFQVPALIQEGITIVICPLISLIQNQILDLKKKNILAKWVRTPNDLSWVSNNPSLKIIYITPERLTNPKFMEQLKSLKISLCVIDEAHCIYEWGNTFRESYRKLGKIKEINPDLTILALSATMTKTSVDDLIQSVRIEAPSIVKGSLFRKNLAIQIYQKRNLEEQLISFLQGRLNVSGVIYCQTKDEVDKIHELLSKNGISSLKYHAGLSKEEREESLLSFLNSERIMVATVAFGMGIDKPNIRYVFHCSMPGSLEQYFQEIGRAGRDGNYSECVMLYSDTDFMNSLILKKEIINPATKKELHIKTNQMLWFAQDIRCRQQGIGEYFTGEKIDEVCGSCDVCQKQIKTINGREFAISAFKAIALTNGELGISSISKFLCSSDVQNFSITQQRSSEFGSMKSYPVSEVRIFLRFLVQRGFIKASISAFDENEGYLYLTPKAMEFAASNAPLQVPFFTNENSDNNSKV